MKEPKIRLTGLTKFDKLDLGEGPGVEYQESELDAGQHGEVTVFTVVLTMALVSTLAAYLLRKHGGQSFEEDIDIIHSDGRIEKRRIRWRANNSEAPEAAIVKQIQAGFPGVT
jgi:hypothetical protein